MSGTYKDLKKQRFGRLTVLRATEQRTRQGAVIWECFCDCGNITFVSTCSLKDKNTQSCGCLHIDRVTKHRECNTRLYRIWANMKYRCNNPKARKYKFYGGAGITVCKEWETSFSQFKEWALSHGYSDNLSIDRINNDGNYEPTNCRWADSVTQNNNRRICRKNNS